MNLDNQKMVECGIITVQFEMYWDTNGKHIWNSKINAWIDWIHDNWNSGLINLEEYRYLINVDVD